MKNLKGKKKSLKLKIMTVLVSMFAGYSIFMLGINYYFEEKNDKETAYTILKSTSRTMAYTLSEYKSELLMSSRLIASLDDVAQGLLSINQYFHMARLVYLEILDTLHEVGLSSGISKSYLFNSQNELVAFSFIEESKKTMGMIHGPSKTVEIATLKYNEKLAGRSFLAVENLPFDAKNIYSRSAGENDKVFFEVLDGELVLIARIPIKGLKYIDTTETIDEVFAGTLITVRNIGTPIIKRMIELIDAQINIFYRGSLLAGSVAEYKRLQSKNMPFDKLDLSSSVQGSSFERISLLGRDYFQFILPIYDMGGEMIPIVSLYPARTEEAGRDLGTLGLIYFLGLLSLIPLFLLMVMKWFIKPIEKVSAMMRDISHKKDFTKKVDVFSEDEIGELSRSFNEMSANLLESTTSIERLNQEILEREKAEKMRTKLSEMLSETSKMASLGVMASGIAHEINNPLAIIKLNLILLKEEFAKGRGSNKILEDSLAVIDQTTDRIEKIVNALLIYSRERNANVEKMDIHLVRNIVENTMSICSEKFRLSGISLENSELPEDIEVRCFEGQISQVLLNLLNNAYDAVIELEDQWVKISCEETDNFVKISVTDSGPNIPPEIREKIMIPFFTTKETGKGTGIGLGISQMIMKRHGGGLNLDINSKNTRFVISLPKIPKTNEVSNEQ